MDLINVKVGDVFMQQTKLWGSRFVFYRIVKCEAVTPKQCTIGGRKYIKDGGRPIGHREYIEAYDKVKFHAGLDKLCFRFMEHFDINLLTEIDKERVRDILAPYLAADIEKLTGYAG